MLVVHVNSAYCDAVDAIRVAVKVAVVIARCTVACRKDVDGALAATSLLYSCHHGFLDQNSWCLHRLAIVWRAPRAGVDVVLLHFIVDSQRFVHIGNLSRKDAYTRYFCIVCQTNSTDVVLPGCNLSSASRAVSVIGELWCWEVFVIVEIVRAFCKEVVLQVAAVVVESVINNTCCDAFACDALHPHVGYIDVVARCLDVENVPLLVKDGILNAEGFCNLPLCCDGVFDTLVRRYYATFPMPGLELLLLCKVYTVEWVVFRANFSLPPPPLQLLSGIVDDVAVVLRRLEDVVVVEGAERSFVGQAEVRREVCWRRGRRDVYGVIVVGRVVALGQVVTACCCQRCRRQHAE